jgi:hypothetical protein
MRAFLFPLPSLFLPHMLVRALLVIRLHLGIEKMHARFHRFFPSRAFERIAPVNANVLLPLRRRQKQPRPHRIALLPRRHGNHRSPRSRNASRPSRHAARIHPCPQVARASQNTQTSPNVLKPFSGDPFQVRPSRGCQRSGFTRTRRSTGAPNGRILKRNSVLCFKPDGRPNGRR